MSGCESGSDGALPAACQDPAAESSAVPRMSSATIWFIRSLCIVASGVSGYLAWTALTMQEVYGCGSGAVFDCGHVLTSRWSKIFGVPVSVPAIALWGSLLAGLAFVRSERAAALRPAIWSIVTLGAFTAGLAGLWFIGLQVFVIEHLCIYCMAAHTCGLILAALMLWKHPIGIHKTGLLAAPALLGVMLLATGQYVGPEPETFTVERFPVAEDANADSDAAMADSDADAAEFFGAPGEIFAPPGAELFGPPDEALPASQPASASENDVSASDSGASSGDSAVAASLLTVTPLRWLLLHALMDAVAMSPAAFADPALLLQDETEQSQASDEDQADSDAENDRPAEPEPRLVSVQGKKFVLNTRQWPLIGEPDAKYIFVEMLDYTCPHCRATHRAVKGACEKYGRDLSVVVLPVPLNRACNSAARGAGHAGACELGTMAVAVWRLSPAKFGEYHAWLMEGRQTRSVTEARRKAEQLVGAAALKTEMDNGVAKAYIQRHVDLYRKVGAGAVPKLMFPGATLTGQVTSTARLCSTIERELAVR